MPLITLSAEIQSEQIGQRLDQTLAELFPEYSRSRLKTWIEADLVKLNNQIVNIPREKVLGGEHVAITVDIEDETRFEPENIPLNIVYEDEELIIINKPAGLVVHPGHGNYQGTLINGLIYHFEHLPQNSSQRPGLVHRIDKDTSGLLVIAKTEYAMNHLSKQFFNKTSEREYIALVWGNITDDEGTIIGNIGRHPKNRLQMAVFPDGSQGKEAITHFKVLERFDYVTLISCRLETGRTHQIRAHFTSIGHPLFNDERYGGDRILKGTSSAKYKQFVENCFKILPRQALHAKTLGVEKPSTGEFLRFDSPLPEDMVECIEKWRIYIQNRL